MKKIISIILILHSIIELYAQKNIIELKHEKFSIPGQSFYIKEVIDGRKNKENIGFVQVGAFNKKMAANFSQGLENELLNYFKSSLTFFSNFEPIVLRVTYLDIYEKTTITEVGRVEVKLEFYRIKENKVGKVFEVEAYEEEFANDVIKGHERRIRKVLTNCLTEFEQSDWENIEPEWITLEELKEDIADVENTVYSINKKIIDIPWANNINLYLSTGFNTNGFLIQYFGYFDTILVGQWLLPTSYSFSYYEFKPDRFNTTNYQSSSYFTCGILLPFIKKIDERLFLSIQGGLGLGLESLLNFENNVKTRFIFDAVSNQFFMIVPKKNFGVNVGIGTYEYFVTSKIRKWDVGVKFMIGFKF